MDKNEPVIHNIPPDTVSNVRLRNKRLNRGRPLAQPAPVRLAD